MKLSTHSQDSRIWDAFSILDRVASRIGYTVAIDPPEAAARKVRDLGIHLIVRHYSEYDFNPDQSKHFINAGISPQIAAKEFADRCRGQAWWNYAWAVMTPPAMATPTDKHILLWVQDWQSAFVEALEAQGKQAIVCNVPTRNDGFFVPGATLYGCQEYGWPTVLSQAPYHALRYRSWFPSKVLIHNPIARLFILECGVTGKLSPDDIKATPDAPHGKDQGFRGGFGIPAVEDYWGSLTAYNAEIEQDPYVEKAFIYGAGMNNDWQTHDILGTEIADLLVNKIVEATPMGRSDELLAHPVFGLWWSSGGFQHFERYLVATEQETASPDDIRRILRDGITSIGAESGILLDKLPLA